MCGNFPCQQTDPPTKMAASVLAEAEAQECSRLWGAFQMCERCDHLLARQTSLQQESKMPEKEDTANKSVTVASSKKVLSGGQAAKPSSKRAEKQKLVKVVKEKTASRKVDVSTITETPDKSDKGVMVRPAKTGFGISGDEKKFLKELAVLKVEMEQVKAELNTERSNRMVAEQLSSIIQQDMGGLQMRMIAESNAKTKLETTLADCKKVSSDMLEVIQEEAQGGEMVELDHSERMLKSKEETIAQLEESLRQSARFAQKLEDQSLLSKIGRNDVDYMLDMQLNKTKTAESKKKLEICQHELLQNHGETQKLLDKVDELMQERSEMVSHRMHSQLLKISDGRADQAEKRAQDLELELEALRGDNTRMQSLLRDRHNTGEVTQSQAAYGRSFPMTSSRTSFASPFSSVAMANTDPYLSIFNTPMLPSQFASPFQSDPFHLDSKMTFESVSEPALTGGVQLGLSNSQFVQKEAEISGKKERKVKRHQRKDHHMTGTGDTSAKVAGNGGKGSRLVEETVHTAAIVSESRGLNAQESIEEGHKNGKGNEDGDIQAFEDKEEDQEEEEGGKGEDDDEGGVLSDVENDSVLPDLDDIVTTSENIHQPPSSGVKVSDVDNDDSSDWGTTSSDDDNNNNGDDTADGILPLPSHPTPNLPQQTISPAGMKGKPPPIKPKPLINFKTKQVFQKEVPSSFRDALNVPSLRKLDFDFDRPHGPPGRRLPSQYVLRMAEQPQLAF